jgi:hypothetical protein
VNRPPHGLDSVPLDVRAPFAHLNAETDFPDDTMSDAERAAIEADERRREAGLAPKTFVSHVEPDVPSLSAEDRAVSLVVGDAMRHKHVNPRDLTAVALPRSQAFRRLAEEGRTAPHVVAMGMSVLLVDRAGQVSGLPFLKSFENQ